MNLQSLRYFVRVVELGSLTKAAADLNIAQPALTRHIQRLEDELGVSLLERASRGVAVTPAGAILYRSGTELLCGADRLKNEMLDHAGRPAGRVMVGIAGTVCPLIAPPLLQFVRAQFPEINIVISEGFSRSLGIWLASGDIDIAILSNGNISAGLQAVKLVEDELLFLTKPDDADPGWISRAALIVKPLILTEGIHKRIETELATNLIVDMKLNSVELIRKLVQDGTGASILPYSTARQDILSGAIQARRIGEHGIFRDIRLCTSETRRMSTATRVVVDTISKVISRLIEAGCFTYAAQARGTTAAGGGRVLRLRRQRAGSIV